MAKIRREFKNVVYNYTDAEVKVREATSNDPWGPSSTLMSELAEYTFHIQAYSLVMGMLWKRLNDNGKNWRHVYKALVVLDYLVKNGSQRVVQQCKDNMFSIETLKDFQYVDKETKDQGTLIREKAKNLAALLKDEQKLEDERVKASKTKGRTTATGGLGNNTTVRSSSTTTGAGTPDSRKSTQQSTGSPSGRFETDHMKQSRPSAKDEEDLQLQLALRMSKEEAEKEEQLKKQEEESLRLALELSKQEGDEEEEQDTTEKQEDDLLGLNDPWEKPPSYDAIATPQNPDDPWVPPVTNTSDPFGGKDPFSSSSNTTTTTTTTDPWKPAPISPTTSPTFGGDDFGISSSTDPWNSFGTTNNTTTTNPITTDFNPDPVDTLPPLNIGFAPPIAPTTTSDPYDFSAFNAPLDNATVTSDEKDKKVEESFLGSNAGLVNLDALVTPLPPPSSINPFGIPVNNATPPTGRSNNPFEGNKAPAPTLQQLQLGSGFDPLPPPLLPTSQPPPSDNLNFNPFS